MDDNRSVDVKGRRIVPNDYTVMLNPADHAGFGDIEDALVSELSEAAREYAREEGYHFMGPVTVQRAVDNNLRSGRFTVVSQLKQAASGPGMGSLVLPSGQRVYVNNEPVVIGRLPECTIAVNDSNISRRHAQVRPGSTAYLVSDLGSTNGTMVNGVKIAGEHRLADGDIISVGATHIRFEAS